MRLLGSARWIVLLVAAAGCVDVAAVDHFACVDDRDCARGTLCCDGFCAERCEPGTGGGQGSDSGVGGGGGQDAGELDGGKPDAGEVDAGSPDAGADDAGLPDAGAGDGGADAGADGGMDAGLPDAGTDQLEFSLPAGIEAGACVAVTVKRTGTGAATAAAVSVSAPFLSIHPDAACSLPLPPLAFPAGTSTLTFYLRGLSSDSVTVDVRVATPSLSVSHPTVALPLVRRGRCAILAGQTSVRCPLAPAIPNDDVSRTFAITQSLSAEQAPEDALASCVLDVAPGQGAGLACRRLGTTGTVTVAWQTASHGRDAANGGWSVRHLSAANVGGSFTLPLNPPANRDTSFLIFTMATVGANWSGNDFLAAQLNNSNVRLNAGGAGVAVPNQVSVQLVEFPAVNVRHDSRGSPGIPFDTNFTAGTAPGQVAAFFSPAFITNPPAILDAPCRYGFSVSRGMNSVTVDRTPTPPCSDVNLDGPTVEVVEFPPSATVIQPTQVLADGVLTASLPLGPGFESHRTLVWSPQMGSGGLGAGVSTASNGPPGAVLAATELTSMGTIEVTRMSGVGALGLAPFVVRFTP